MFFLIQQGMWTWQASKNEVDGDEGARGWTKEWWKRANAKVKKPNWKIHSKKSTKFSNNFQRKCAQWKQSKLIQSSTPTPPMNWERNVETTFQWHSQRHRYFGKFNCNGWCTYGLNDDFPAAPSIDRHNVIEFTNAQASNMQTLIHWQRHSHSETTHMRFTYRTTINGPPESRFKYKVMHFSLIILLAHFGDNKRWLERKSTLPTTSI